MSLDFKDDKDGPVFFSLRKMELTPRSKSVDSLKSALSTKKLIHEIRLDKTWEIEVLRGDLTVGRFRRKDLVDLVDELLPTTLCVCEDDIHIIKLHELSDGRDNYGLRYMGGPKFNMFFEASFFDPLGHGRENPTGRWVIRPYKERIKLFVSPYSTCGISSGLDQVEQYFK